MRPISGRERRRVSTLFVDLAGFSRLTRGFDPEQVRDLADEVLTVVAGAIEDYDGYVDAFRGDGLIALFGAPRAHPDDEHRAVRAAHAAVTAIEKVGRDRGFPLQGRAGVNTGIVIAGAVGSGRASDYTVMGSAVNLAARLEAAAEPGEVWVGPETHDVTRGQFEYAAVTPIDIPGFPSVREVYRLVRIPDAQNDDPYAAVPFIGRAEELDRLHAEATEVARTGAPRRLWVVGEAGSGKSRLLHEFAGRIGGTHDILWLDAKAAKAPDWHALAQQMFHVREGEEREGEGSASPATRIAQALEEVLPGESRWHRIVLTSLGLAPKKVWTRLERRRANRTNLVWRDLLAAWARRSGGPHAVVLIVENGPKSGMMMEFLDLLQVAEAPILVLASRRRDTLHEHENTLYVETLPVEQSLQLIAHVTIPHIRLATESLVGQVGGNPGHLLELGRALSVAQEGTLSSSLAALLQARLDMIEPQVRRLLADASLAGDHVWSGLLAALAGGTTRDATTLVEQALLVEWPESSIPGEAQYRFQSELLRNAAMRMVPFGERPYVHLRIASWLEQNAPASAAEHIAHQFRLAGSHDAAHAHYMKAVSQAHRDGDRRRVDRLFLALAELEVGPELLADGALAHAEAALGWGDRTAAARLLVAAKAHLDRCDVEQNASAMQHYRRLAAALDGASGHVEPAA